MPRSAPCLNDQPPVEASPKRTRRTVQSWAEAHGEAYVEALRILGPKVHDAVRCVMEADEAVVTASDRLAELAIEVERAERALTDAQATALDCRSAIARIDNLARSISDACFDTPEPVVVDANDPGPVPSN